MKKVLITGAGSYIGTSFAAWIKENNADILTDTVDMQEDAWRQRDFSGYDTIFHVAGIAHADVGKVSEEQKQCYYKVNTELTVECAKKAKAEGVAQFIFMSSMIVYGESAGIGRQKMITPDTPPSPANFYGDSKLKAEEGLLALQSPSFKVVLLRPPMIYGKGAKGNYRLLSKLAVKLPIFPKENNLRSMLYIGNLCKFVELMIKNEEQGTFYPQNSSYIQTAEMVAVIGAVHGRKIHLTKLFHPILLFMGKIGGKPGELVNKAFGNMTYDLEMSSYREAYQLYGLEESVKLTEE